MILHCVEIHLSDVCNLNCRGCSHFANIETEPNFPTLEEFSRDLIRLRTLVDGVRLFRLMGGEPLKNKQFLQYLRCAREIFPESDISLVSNGLLLPDISTAQLQMIADLQVQISISLYPPTMAIKDKLIDLFNTYGIGYTFTPPITKFRRKMDLTASCDSEANFAGCIFKDYSFLYHGRFAICSSPILIEKFNKKFGQNLSVGEDVLDLYDPKVDKACLERYMTTAKACCRYCGQPEEFDWNNQGEPKMEDWLVRK